MHVKMLIAGEPGQEMSEGLLYGIVISSLCGLGLTMWILHRLSKRCHQTSTPMPTVPGNVADPANLVPQAASRTHEERIAEERMKNAVLIENPDGEIKFGRPTDDSTADCTIKQQLVQLASQPELCSRSFAAV